jgi:hypothetical protein
MGIETQLDAATLLAGSGWAVAVSEESVFSILTSTRGGITAWGAETGSVQNSAIPPF